MGRTYCIRCPVRAACEEYRQDTKSEHGMWAGELYTRKDPKVEDDS